MAMKIGYWEVQTDIKKALEDKGYKPMPLDWHAKDWHKQFFSKDCDAYIWYPHALHDQWYKLWDRSFFIENYLGKRCFPSSASSYLFQDKQHQKYICDCFGFPTPKTDILTTKAEAEKFFDQTNYPVLVKDIWGYGGYGIEKISGKTEADEYLRKKKMPRTGKGGRREHYIYVQEIVKVAEEFRVITVGQEVILAYKKTSSQLLKHVWRGAKVSFDVDPRVKDLVLEWNKKLKLDWCGWDLVSDDNDRLFLLELNPVFGTKVLEQQDFNLADYLVEHLEQQIKE
jgi:ribosomal protein S6--L-glutamate ligase